MKRRLMTAGLAAAAGFALAVTVPNSAYAAELGVLNSRGYAWFQSDGDILYVQDNAADGYGTRAEIQAYAKWYGDADPFWKDFSPTCHDDTSKGSPETKCDFNIAENFTIRVHIWSSKDGRTYDHKYSVKGVS